MLSTLPEQGVWLEPLAALRSGRWIKWIGGASNHDLLALEDLAALASLAGAHCLDVAADAAVVAAVRRGIGWARARGAASSPWLMLSISDGEDPHFRKAHFDPRLCPPQCPRPCARVCPARAIGADGGVLQDRCYGCGRCLGACPLGLVVERQQRLSATQLAELLVEVQPDAIEIHTCRGRSAEFAQRLGQLQDAGLRLSLLSVSCGENLDGPAANAVAMPDLPTYLWQLHGLICQTNLAWLWQLDGRPMSGDVGAGTAQAAVNLLQRWHRQLPPGPLQLAGGTNSDSRRRLAASGGSAGIAGIAYGGSARSLLQPFLEGAEQRGKRLLDCPDLWPLACGLLAELWGAPASLRNLLEPWMSGAEV